MVLSAAEELLICVESGVEGDWRGIRFAMSQTSCSGLCSENKEIRTENVMHECGDGGIEVHMQHGLRSLYSRARVFSQPALDGSLFGAGCSCHDEDLETL